MSRTQKQTVLAMLEAAGDRGVTSAEFYAAYLPRFSARLLELREEGHVVSSERLRDSAWRYTLLNSPAVSPAPTPRASALTHTDAETGAAPSPPAPSGVGADETAAAVPDGSTHRGLDESTSGAAEATLFDLPPTQTSHYEAA